MDCRCADLSLPVDDADRATCNSGYICATSYYYAPTAGSASNDICSACPTGCATCNVTDLYCSQCNPGYTTSDYNGACSVCPAHCDTCDHDANGVVLCDTNGCATGYDVNSGRTLCSACPSNCAACTLQADSSMRCDACSSGYTRDTATYTCQECPRYCTTCSWDGSGAVCNSNACQAGTVYSSGACYACPSFCTTCTYDTTLSASQCTVCSSGYATDNGVCTACPSNCNSCSYDNALVKVVCDSSSCQSGFGRKADKLCYACPDNCVTCSPDANDVLMCDTCNTGYVRNQLPCGACPGNCVSCRDDLGSMICSACAHGYVLDSSKTCNKCPSHCSECIISGAAVLCKKDECTDGYGLSSDRTQCSDCATLTGVTNCDRCDDASANVTSVCEHCTTGYTIKDDNSACLDVSALGVCSDPADHGYECSACATGYNTTEDLKCAIYCQECSGTVDQCNKANFNYTSQPCHNTCWAKYTKQGNDVTVSRGCRNETTCGQNLDSERCLEANNRRECDKCCNTNNCNSWQMTGSDVGHVTIDLMLLMVASLTLAGF